MENKKNLFEDFVDFLDFVGQRFQEGIYNPNSQKVFSTSQLDGIQVSSVKNKF